MSSGSRPRASRRADREATVDVRGAGSAGSVHRRGARRRAGRPGQGPRAAGRVSHQRRAGARPGSTAGGRAGPPLRGARTGAHVADPPGRSAARRRGWRRVDRRARPEGAVRAAQHRQPGGLGGRRADAGAAGRGRTAAAGQGRCHRRRCAGAGGAGAGPAPATRPTGADPAHRGAGGVSGAVPAQPVPPAGRPAGRDRLPPAVRLQRRPRHPRREPPALPGALHGYPAGGDGHPPAPTADGSPPGRRPARPPSTAGAVECAPRPGGPGRLRAWRERARAARLHHRLRRRLVDPAHPARAP